MILYEGTIERFNEDVMQNCIADRAAEKYRAYYKKDPADREYRSWAISLAILNNSFHYAGLKDNHIIVEYELPFSSRRIDVLLFGHDVDGEENVVMMELKQWSNQHVQDAESEGNVVVDYGQFKREQPHPVLQVQGYYFGLKDFLRIFQEKNSPELSASVYLHNYSKNKDAILFSSEFSKLIKTFPLFAKEDAIELGRYLKKRLQGGKGKLIYERFARSPIEPSRKLLDHTSEMINKRQIFNLIDEQIVAYNAIRHKVKQFAKTKQKSVVIVKGGPGTGKSVIALEVMGELLRQGRKVVHATGSSAFTNTLRNIVGVRAKNLFKFFNSFIATKSGSFDVLICDEAHRIRESSIDRYTPKVQRTDLPQIDELLNVAKLSIFFIDENQIVRPNEIGSVEMIKKAVQRLGIKKSDISEFELKTQFRCSGSDAYLQWLDFVLRIGDSEFSEYDPKMEFKIFKSPQEMMEEIRKRNHEKPNSARITAGFCWSWSKPIPDNSLVNDVKIGNFEMPWEKKDQFWKWATDDSGMEQVGTVYTAQGFEFDYIAVIFGNDLVFDPVESKWRAIPENSHDTQVKRNNPNLTNHLKNVYRVLLSRAHKGVYVYFIDKDTEKYLKSHLPEI
ncbi:MAG TPA: DUF2075 domain-containing protein [Candidatus Bathyarchaeia archaeon]|nr:DUF2075 domain-containing protein [Candidatus Bathyarchaeia archaeon]